VPKKLEQIYDYLFIDKSNKIKIGRSEMGMIDSEMSMK